MSAKSGTRWLLAAEADQIQDLIFQASELRQIVGGSQLLERFCSRAPELLLDRHVGVGAWSDADLIIHRGGAFRVLFDDEERALAFGLALTEAYRQVTGGSLSLGEPVAFEADDYRRAQAEAHRSLVTAKRRGGTPSSTAQLPYAGICASCGRGLAVTHRARPGVDDDPPDYLCADCRAKFSEAYDRPSTRDYDQEPFLGRFRQTVRTQGQNWGLRRPRNGDWAGAIAGLDGNRMVAYLAADGNGMGEVFGACAKAEHSRKLSEGMEETMRAALAGACTALLALRPEVNELAVQDPEDPSHKRTGIMPLVPLILGGDDLFAVLPAPWAVDLGCRVIRAWEVRLAETLTELGLDHRPTLSAALVFCKANYPHTLARRRCEQELARAKRVSHAGGAASVLTYAVITGNQVGGGASRGEDRLQTTLAPFQLNAPWLSALFTQRRALARVPRKRLHELEQLFDGAPSRMPDLRIETFREQWRVPLDGLLERIARSSQDDRAVRAALASLGGAPEPYGWWQPLDPPPPWAEVTPVYGHGLPDLLRLWPFLERVDPREEDPSC